MLIDRAVCWTPQFLHLAKFRYRARAPENVYIVYQHRRRPNISFKVLLTSVKHRRYSNEAKTRNPLKFAGVPQTRQPISTVTGLVGRSSPYCEEVWRRYCCLTIFSERELTFTFAICCHPSVCRLSVVCITFVCPTQTVKIFDNVSALFCTLAIRWHPWKSFTEIVPWSIRRGLGCGLNARGVAK